jgi:AmmeMemoRadiSam system protein B/AmmeMemoRadiSam system protein A
MLILFPAGCKSEVKEPSVAGAFYPADKDTLKKFVETVLSKADSKPSKGRLIALISPHAGYIYSGQVAAYGYKQIKGSGIKKVILIGPSHYAAFKGASIYTKGGFKTPLGIIKINEKLAEKLLNEKADVRFYPEAFAKEHSLEVQLPFLQTVLNDFTIVPIVVGSPTQQTLEHLVSGLTDIMDDKSLIIASTDLSHYHDYATARTMDSKVVSAIERLSLVDMEKLLKSGEGELCGVFPVLIAMEVARRTGANEGVVFHYENSGDVTGEKDKVVGYASIGLYENLLTEGEKKEILDLAKKTVNEYVTSGKVPDIDEKNPKLKADGAVFVTIKKDGHLRGCIGNIQPVMPLYQSVIRNSVAACSSDPRFPPMKKEELENIDIEVSILSPLIPLKNINDIKIGKHGLVLVKGMQSGLLLPQVATEFGWDRNTFLEQLSQKAGLPKDAWKDANLYTFTAEIIK